MNLIVPDGWSVEPIEGTRHMQFVLRSELRSFATLDMERRGFRLGHIISGPLRNTRRFMGRGWQQRLCDAAVSLLRSIERRS